MKTNLPKIESSSFYGCLSLIALIVVVCANSVVAQTTNTFPENGNAGVGTTSPTSPASVNKFVHIKGTTASVVLDETSGNKQWEIFNDGNGLLRHYSSTHGDTITFDQSGNVGIGTTSPAYPLHLSSMNPQLGFTNTQGGSSYYMNVSPNTGFNIFEAGVASWFTINNGGNVGIGTTSPAARLTVAAAGGDAAIQMQFSSSYGQTRLYTGYDSSTSSGNYLAFRVNQMAGTDTEIMRVRGDGNVGIGISNPTSKLHVSGDGKFTGNLAVDGNISAKYQDVAEWVPSPEQLAAGTVVILDSTKSNQVTSSTVSYDTRVAGVVSQQPGIALGEKSENKVLVATTGRVRVKVDASKGAIHVGDLLVTSDIPGVAMKSEPVNLGGVQIHRPGTLIGKALEPLEKGKGEILVLLSLQ